MRRNTKDTNTLDAPRIRLTSAEELLDAVPGLLGFRPAYSVVVVVVRDGLVAVTMRCDLEHGPELGAVVRRHTYGSGVAAAYIIAYGPRSVAESTLGILLMDLGPLMRDGLVVDGDRWWRVHDPANAAGHPLPVGGWAASALARPEIPVAASREDLAARIEAPRGEREDECLSLWVTAVEESRDGVDPGLAATLLDNAALLAADGHLTDEDYITAAVAMDFAAGREVLWRHLTRDNADQLEQFWCNVMRRVPRGLRVIPAAVTGMVAWVAGDGALANICLYEATTGGDEITLVAVLRDILAVGLPPTYWEEVVSGLDAQDNP